MGISPRGGALVKNSFVKIRTGLEEHLVRGRIGFFELGVYTTLHLQADYRTGIWIGSAPRLLATAPRGTGLRSVQRAIQRLVDIEFIRTFHTPGARGNYHVLIHKYEPTFGAQKGKRLNALQSISWQSPVYEPCAEVDAERHAEDAPLQEVRVKKKPTPLPPVNGGNGLSHDELLKDRNYAYFTHRGQAIVIRTNGKKRIFSAQQEHDLSIVGDADDAVRKVRSWGYWCEIYVSTHAKAVANS